MFSLEHFFPKYPNINEKNFESMISGFKEFKKLEKIEKIPSTTGHLMAHQINISRFLSSYTPYSELLLFWDTGTGKTCGAVSVIELLREQRVLRPYVGALILVKGVSLINNFRDELIFRCTNNKYIPEDWELLTEGEKTRRINSKIKDFYTFGTFETFAKEIQKMEDDAIKEKFNNRIIVIDEVHNLREQAETNSFIYDTIHHFLHIIKNRKILLMSGTPMKDKPNEFSSIINLILPLNSQLEVGKEFIEKYFLSEHGIPYLLKSEMKNDLKERIKGRVSYLKSMESNVEKHFEINKYTKYLTKIKHYRLFPNRMSPFQEKVCERAWLDDTKPKNKQTGIFLPSRQASLFVFPNGDFGEKGFKRYVTKADAENTRSYTLSPALTKELSGDTQEKLEKLHKFSCKFADVISIILNGKGNVFVYCDLVKGSGVILFSKILELFGYRKSIGKDKVKGKRYALISGETITTKQVTDILLLYNSSKNVMGEYVQIIIGSRMSSEGYTFKNVQQVHILTPHWNFSETHQAISRAYRLGSHSELMKFTESPLLRIYLHCVIGKNLSQSIDLKMYYKSEKKDIVIKQLEKLIKESAFDCILFHDRNLRTTEKDGSRECDFDTCDFVCDFESDETFQDNYLTMYDNKEQTEIMASIQNILRKNGSVTLICLLNSLKNRYNMITIIKTITKCIEDKIIFTNKFGENSYLYEDGGTLFFSIDIFQSTSNSIYYNMTPNIKVFNNFDELANKIYRENIPTIIDRICLTYDEKLLRKLPYNVQEILIENAILGYFQPCKNIKMRDFILKFYKDNIIEDEDVWISDFLLENNVIRCFSIKDKTWSDCSEELKKKIENIKEHEKQNLEQKNPYGYYGILDKKTLKKGKEIFKIRDISKDENIVNIDNRLKTKGRTCDTNNKDFLIKVACATKLNVPDKFMKMDRKELLTKTKIPKIKNIIAKLFKKQTLDDDILRIIVYCATLKGKNEICEKLKKHFEKLKLLEII